MSTRRARIKAVASLPVRRKNQDTKDKQSTPKRQVENVVTPVGEPPKVAENLGEAEKVVPEAITQQEQPTNECKANLTPLRGRRTSAHTPNLIERGRTPKSKEHIVSPHRKLSPAIKHAASPLALPLEQNSGKQTPSMVRSGNTSPGSSVIQSSRAEILRNILKETADKDPSSIDGISSLQNYNPPSIPESTIDETGLDGIVPLQSNRAVPKPLDLLKNEIISESAEVSFDPIVPLPSPSKVRPKLRPAPRLAFRRNSIQGSASESEDESRRALLNSGAATPAPSRQRHDSQTSHGTQYTLPNRDVNRVRNDSICSSVSQVAQPQPPPCSTNFLVIKEKPKPRRTDMSRRVAAMRRRQRGRENVPRDALTMYDLIFFNPTTNPIVPEPEESTVVKPAESKEPEVPPPKVEEEKVDDPPEKDDAAPVPQIKLGPNGEIILDEKSLVIEQTEGPRKLSSSVVHETDWANSGRGKYTRRKRTADWSDAETVRFYRALAAVGTDFSLMSPLFPDRTRRDLKQKFKKEERSNCGQVDKALRSQTQWDASRLEAEFQEERRAAAEKAAKLKQAYLEQKRAERARTKTNRHEGFRHSRGAKAIEFNTNRAVMSGVGSADDLIESAIQAKLDARKPKQPRTRSTKPPKAPAPKKPIPQLLPLTPKPHEYATLVPQTRQPMPVAMSYLMPNIPKVPSNIENGSLVVLTVDDPNEPSKKMLQTYISHAAGKLTPVALPPALLNSVVSYMKKGTPKSGVSNGSSPQLTSPSSVASQESRSSVIQFNPSPSKRARHNSFTITPL